MQNSILNHSDIRTANRLDAEYFQPKFLKLQKKLERRKYIKLHELCEVIRTGPAGGALLASKYKASGIKVIRPSNLNGWNCDNVGFVYISEKYCKNQHIILYKKGDLLITRIGDIKFGILQEDKNRAAISPNLIALRTKKEVLDPYFLLALLHTKFGLPQIKRGEKIVSLSSVGIVQISNMLIPAVALKEQIKIARLVKKGLQKTRLAKILYSKAENSLLQMTGFSNTAQSHFLKQINFSKLKDARRLDAEYFLAPKYRRQENIKTIQIGEIAQILRGIDPGRRAYQKSGKLFLRVSNIGKYGLSNKSQKYMNIDLYEKLRGKYQPCKGEVLLVKDGNPGVALTVSKPIEGIISDGIVRLKLNTCLDPEYISLCINSACQPQISIHKDGSLVPHWKIEQIRKLKIPVLALEERKNLTDNVKKSLKLFREGKNDLSLAVIQVESLIDG